MNSPEKHSSSNTLCPPDVDVIHVVGKPCNAFRRNERSAINEMIDVHSLLSDFLEDAADVLLIVDDTGEILYATPSLEQWTGYQLRDIEDRNIVELVHDYNAVMHLLTNASGCGASGHRIQCLLPFRQKDGSERMYIATATSHLDDQLNAIVVRLEDLSVRQAREMQVWMQHEVSDALANSPNLTIAASRIVHAVGYTLNWQFGALWEKPEHAIALANVASWTSCEVGATGLEQLNLSLELGLRAGIPGTVLNDGRSLWVEDVMTGWDSCPRRDFAVRNNIHGACAVPIIRCNEVIGVMEFATRDSRRFNPKAMHILAGVSRQVALFMERKRAEQRLRALRGKLRIDGPFRADSVNAIVNHEEPCSTTGHIDPVAEVGLATKCKTNPAEVP